MSYISSKFPEIEAICFEPFPQGKAPVHTVFTVRQVTVGLGADGKIFVSGAQTGTSYSGPNPMISALLEVLVKNSLLRRRVARAHIKHEELRRKKEDIARRLSLVEYYFLELGIELTPEQRRKMNELSRYAHRKVRRPSAHKE